MAKWQTSKIFLLETTGPTCIKLHKCSLAIAQIMTLGVKSGLLGHLFDTDLSKIIIILHKCSELGMILGVICIV